MATEGRFFDPTVTDFEGGGGWASEMMYDAMFMRWRPSVLDPLSPEFQSCVEHARYHDDLTCEHKTQLADISTLRFHGPGRATVLYVKEAPMHIVVRMTSFSMHDCWVKNSALCSV